MTMERPGDGEMARITYVDDDGNKGEVVGEVEYSGGFDGDWGIRVVSAEHELPVFARTYAPEVYMFDGEERHTLGEVESVEAIDDE